MANQHTVQLYQEKEINEILLLYKTGMSYTKISHKLHRKKTNIKKILINCGVWVENRDIVKKKFTDNEIQRIINLYVNEYRSTHYIAKLFNMSVIPINRILKENNVLRKGNSNGRKIDLNDEQQNKIKDLYLNQYLSVNEIGCIIGCSGIYISKYLKKNGLLRTISEANKISSIGRKASKIAIENMKLAQKKLVLSGKRKQTGGICKTFIINDLKCQGMSEKSYIELLIKNNEKLPQNGELIITPFGGYYPDFKYVDKLIEIKSTYTYDILIGNKINRWTHKYDTTQYDKIKWVNENIIPVEIIIIEKNNIKNIIKI